MAAADSFTFTVGKLDAGMAILIGERAHLIEFPSLLLPPGVTSGSIVNIAVHRNHAEEKRQRGEFWELQDQIAATYGKKTPQPPKLELRNVTQTSVTLEWPSLDLATSKLRSLDIYRNGQRLAAIPAPLQNTSTKLSGLEVKSEYTFQLILRTTAGTFPSNVIKVRTHAISDTSGISVCFGNVQDPVLLERAKLAIEEMRAKWSDRIQIDTTHFICTTPAATPSGAHAAGNSSGAPGVEYQKALQLSIPVVQPQWVLACLQEKKMMPISSFYLGATPSTAISPATFTRPKSLAAPRSTSPPTSPNQNHVRSASEIHSPTPQSVAPRPPPSPESRGRATTPDTATPSPPPHLARTESSASNKSNRPRNGTMKKDFKFPPDGPPTPAPPPVPKLPGSDDNEGESVSFNGDIPPPTPVEKEKQISVREENDHDEDVGDTVEVDLS